MTAVVSPKTSHRLFAQHWGRGLVATLGGNSARLLWELELEQARGDKWQDPAESAMARANRILHLEEGPAVAFREGQRPGPWETRRPTS